MINKHQVFERGLSGLLLGAVPVIACFMAGWWGSISFVPENQVFIWALAGLALGVLVDVVFLRNWLVNAFALPVWVWIGVYLFYSIGCFGFFMGVPVFNLLLAIPAGFYAGVKLAHDHPSQANTKMFTSRTAWFTTAVLAVVCAASAAIALTDAYTPVNLEGMFRLKFAVTLPMLLGVILTGGVGLLAANWWLVTRVTMQVYRSFAIQNQ